MIQSTEFSQQKWAIWGAVGVVLIWSHWIIVSRLGVNSQLTPLDISLLRFGTATLFTIPFWMKYDWKKVNITQSVIVALGTGFPYTLLSFYGMQTAKAARAGVLINGLLPVFGAVFAVLWMKHQLKTKHFIGILLVLIANFSMLYFSGFQVSASIQLFGVLCLICASCVYSVYMTAVKVWGFTFQDVIAQVPIINLIFLFPIWFFSESHILTTPFENIALQSIYQGVIVTLGAGTLVTNAIQKLGAVTTSLFVAFVPAMAAVLGFLYLNESLSIVELATVVLCTVGIVVYTKA